LSCGCVIVSGARKLTTERKMTAATYPSLDSGPWLAAHDPFDVAATLFSTFIFALTVSMMLLFRACVKR
jgi:hypothetical protein